MNISKVFSQQPWHAICEILPPNPAFVTINDPDLWVLGAARTTAIIFSRLGIPETYPTNKSYSYAWGISADSSKVVGYSYNGTHYEAFLWDSTNRMRGLGFLTIDSPIAKERSSSALNICADGSRIVGQNAHDNNTEAFVWDSTNGMQRLAFLRTNTSGRSSSAAYGICADGSKVVGRSFNGTHTEAFLWDSAYGMQRLGFLDTKDRGYFHSIAYGICDRGSKIVGQSYNGTNAEAFIWDSTNKMQGLGFLGTNAWGESRSDARAISADGSKVVGHSYNGTGDEAFIWDSNRGMQGLGFLGADASGRSYSYAKGICADGSRVVGKSYNSSGDEAFIWDNTKGMRSLTTLLKDDFGINLPGWTLIEATGISRDGLTIVGNGINPSGRLEGWVLRLINL